MTEPVLALKSSWKGRRWIAFVFALILLNMTICAVTVYAARVSQPPIERGYDAKALTWDLSRQQREMNQKLGWRAEYSIAGHDRDSRSINIALFDSSGRPIRTARCSAKVSADDTPENAHLLELSSHEDGTYSASLPQHASGWLNITLSAEAAGLRFVDSSRALASLGTGGDH